MFGPVGALGARLKPAIDRLQDAGVIRALTSRKRNQVWVAASLADELDDLGLRISTRARSEMSENARR